MADAARTLYDSLVTNADLQGLRGRAEDLHFEAKRCPSFDSRMKGYISQALSGFANSDGGVLVLGLSTERQGDDEPDVVHHPEPFPEYVKVASEMQTFIGDAVMPPVDGVLIEPVESGNPDHGYVKMLVPASDAGPHRAMSRYGGDREYWKRSGGRFYRMEHYDLADMFGRRPQSRLEVEWRFVGFGVARRSQDGLEYWEQEWGVRLVLFNRGRGLARFPLLEVDLSSPLHLHQYGGQHTPGLRLQPLPSGWQFAGDGGHVVHPGARLEVATITGARIRRVDNAPWQLLPEAVHLPYRVAAGDMPLTSGEIRINVAEQLDAISRVQ